MRKISLFACLLTLCLACSKSDEVDSAEITEPSNLYQPLSIGSYWIYENYKVDTNGVIEKLSQIDTVRITKDTVVNDYTYAVFEGTDLLSSAWRVLGIRRDSSGYLVDEKGSIFFSAFNFTDILLSGYSLDSAGDTLFQYSSKMVDSIFRVSVPKGEFDCLNYRTTFKSELFPPGMETRIQDYYYAENIGLVQSNFFYASTTDVIFRKLVFCNIEN